MYYYGYLSFQFTASYEADLEDHHKSNQYMTFQFTASYEADLFPILSMVPVAIFQFTASYEADRKRVVPIHQA